MRRTVIAALATMVLGIGLLSPPAAHAAANSYVVSGHPITAAPGMALLGDSCSTSGATPPTVNTFERDGGTLGSSALGWSITQADFEAGPVATLAGNPDTLNTYHVDVLAPAGTSGHAYARINWDADTWYIGWASVDVPASGWQVLDLVNRSYTWTLYDAGTTTTYESPFTVQAFVTGPGFQAISLGVLLGCGGEQFFVDRMVVGNAENSSSYDFEKKPPPPPPDTGHLMAHMEWSTNGKDVEVGEGLTIRYGQRVWMLGHGHLHFANGTNEWYSGQGTLYKQPATGDRTAAASGTFNATQYAGFPVAPKTNTIYQFTVAGHQGRPTAESKRVTVWVQPKVKAKIRDKNLVQGQTLAVRGRILPAAKRVKVTLQRKVGKKWTKLSTSRTKKRGRFDLATTVRQTGSWKVRVTVAATLDNAGTTTSERKVTVKRYVPPKKNPGPPKPPPPDPTPEVGGVSTPPPPPAPPEDAPKPPPRPTNTGRIAADADAGGVTGRVRAGAVEGESGAKP
jgi:hypothetical protein